MDDALRAGYAPALDHWLGPPGRRVDPTVAGKVIEGYTHAVVFNASVWSDHGELWSGDIDLTEDEAKLQALAEDTQQTIYVLGADEEPRSDDPASLEARAIYWVNPTGGTGYSSDVTLRPDLRLAIRLPTPRR